MQRVRVFNQALVQAPAAKVWEWLTDWAGSHRQRRPDGMGELTLAKIALIGVHGQIPRAREMHFGAFGLVRETLLYQNDEAMHLYYNIEGTGPCGVKNYLATTDVDAICETVAQVTISARFDLDAKADVVKAKSVIDFAHNEAVIGSIRRYLETS
ncbi:MAG: SRPBCC family protein [Steroidobacteraceae bacterium]